MLLMLSLAFAGPVQSLTSDMRADLLSLPALDGALTAEELEDNVVVVAFFASWCGPCNIELGHLTELQKEYGDSGVKIVAVNYFEGWNNQSNDAKLAGWLKKKDYPFTVVKGSDTSAKLFGSVTKIPTLFVFRPDGTVARHSVQGADTFDQLSALVRPMLISG